MWWAGPADARPWLMALFNDDERQRLDALRQPRDRARFTVGCGLVRLLAGAYLGQPPAAVPISRRCQECGQPHGKPRLNPPAVSDLELSVSHAGDRVVVACGRGSPVGVDVELFRPEVEVNDLVDLVASPDEKRALMALPRHARAQKLILLWTRKEAVLKATGHGLTVPMPAVIVSTDENSACLNAWPEGLGDSAAVSLHDLNAGAGYVAAVCVLGPCTEVVAHDGSTLLARG